MEIGISNFRVVHASGGDWRDLTEACINQLGDTQSGENIGFVYVTDALDKNVRAIVDRLRGQTGISQWVGTVGFGICVSGIELFDTPSIAIMLGRLPPDSFRVLPSITPNKNELPKEIVAWSKNHNPTLGIIHADPRSPGIEETLGMLQENTGCFLVGGMTSSRGAHEQISNDILVGGVSGILFGSEIAVHTGLTQGCSPIGDIHLVTAAEENVIYSLDNRPAFEVFKADIGDLLSRDLSRVMGYVHVAMPIEGSDTGDYLVRNLIGISPDDESIAVGQHLKPGDRMMFVRRDGASAIADLKRMVSDLKLRASGAPKAAFYFSCVARGPNLFGRGSVELKTIQGILGERSLIGFFANGEISNNRLYGYTGVLTLIG
ncbi:MAG: FIST N-terminal domain-containing protein [Rhodospirillaceae bacterium]